MKSGWLVPVVMTLALGGCDRIKDKISGSAEGGAGDAGASASATQVGATPGKKEEENLFSAGAGAMVVSLEPVATTNYDEWMLLDEKLSTGWFPSTPNPKVFKLTLALPQPTTVKKLSLHGAAKKITVEATASPLGKDGFQKIAEKALVGTKEASFESAAFQDIPVTKEMQARVFRITFENPFEESCKNNELRAYGVKHADPAMPVANITGTYTKMEGSLQDLHVKQQGTQVSGCVGDVDFAGEIEGGLVKGQWWQHGTNKPAPVAFNVTPDGNSIVYLRYTEGGAALFKFTGTKKSADAGTCPSWKEEAAKPAPVDPIAADIERFGRARIYGIKFDTDSDVPRPESKAVIDRVIAVMKAKPDWKLMVEGHTDNTATADYNQGLSDRRAKAVKKALEAGGIAPARLDAKGFGQTKPVAPNDTTLGRAENRRVELAKQ